MAVKKIWMSCAEPTDLCQTKNFPVLTELAQVGLALFNLRRMKTIRSVWISFWTLLKKPQTKGLVMIAEIVIEVVNHPRKGEKITDLIFSTVENPSMNKVCFVL